MRCISCGSENGAGAKFCSQCGMPLSIDTTATMQLDVSDTSDRLLRPIDAATVEALPVGNGMLVVQRGPGAGQRFLLDEDLITVGRHPDSNIFLDDVTVSRQHADFRRSGGTFEVSDAGSLNGTYVNRDRIERVLLTDGDEVQIGKFKLVFYSGHEDN